MSSRLTDEVGIDVTRSPSSHHHGENLLYIHKVGVPPRQKILKEFTSTWKETFFHDEPLHPFKDQPKSQKLVLGLQSLFPILAWGRDYNLSKFKGTDLMARLTIASLAIPQVQKLMKILDIYAKLANLDPQFGLYTSFVPPLVYAFMGSSRDIAIGPVAVVSLLLGTLLQNEIDPANKVEYKRLAFMATFFAGITQATLGVLRLGFLIDFLSHAAIVGFMDGAAITIGLQQLKGFLGLKTFTKKTDLVSVMRSVWTTVHHGESIAIGRSFAAIKDYELDGNKEMVALGTMNDIGSMTSCYVATGSFSHTAVNFTARCNTAVSNIVMSCVLLLTLLVITPLFKYTPNAVIASIIISAVMGLIDIEATILIWKVDKLDFIACMGAFFGVVFVLVEIGLLIAIGLSFAKILLQVTRPRTALPGKLPTTSVYRNMHQYPDATNVPGFLIVRVDSAIYFSNSHYVKEY
ncbi:hypothetical protein RHGRI_031473 [Rhododendron griersonianum]|uniref:STAS domain-containing protein n=1 Tax=Rhododendron griersonianum TaxID=479676 RepID=A0AAV6I7Z5_9ERIC|nr:hypothetical protein RHGRI_031473 [Rhododendron griersonianum]